MPLVALFLIDGFEETEAIATADILRRGGLDVTLTSLENERTVRGKHGIPVIADTMLSDLREDSCDMLVLPGGTTEYLNRPDFLALLQRHGENGKAIAAICAAPAVLGRLGMLQGKRAVCYPGMEEDLRSATRSPKNVEMDGTLITGLGPGATIAFALRVVESLQGKAKADDVARAFLFDRALV